MKKFLIVKMGETLTHLAERRGDFEDWIIASLNIDPNSIRVVRAYDGNPLPNPVQLSGVVITGSHAMGLPIVKSGADSPRRGFHW